MSEQEQIEEGNDANGTPLYLDISSASSHQTCHKWNRCGRPDCIHCSQIATNKRTLEVIQNINHRQLHRLVLTLKADDQTLSHRLDRLYESFYRLRRHDYWQEHIQGGLSRLHVDHGGTSWNPHFDILIETSSRIEAAILKDCWLLATGDSHVLKIQHVRNTDLDKWRLTRYVMKPPFKSIYHDPNLMEEYLSAVKRRKKVQRFGSWMNSRSKRDNWKKLPKFKPERKPTTKVWADPFA